MDNLESEKKRFSRWKLAGIAVAVTLLSLLNGDHRVPQQVALVAFSALAIVLLFDFLREAVRMLDAGKSVTECAKEKIGKTVRASAEVIKSIQEKSEKKKQEESSIRYENLMKLKNLLDQGAISEEEFEREKRKIMSD